MQVEDRSASPVSSFFSVPIRRGLPSIVDLSIRLRSSLSTYLDGVSDELLESVASTLQDAEEIRAEQVCISLCNTILDSLKSLKMYSHFLLTAVCTQGGS